MDNREALRDAWGRTIANDGGHCPVCDRWGKIYLRNINVTMAQGLMWLCRQTGDADGWINVPVSSESLETMCLPQVSHLRHLTTQKAVEECLFLL